MKNIFWTHSFQSRPAALSLHFVSLGAYNKGYTVRGSTRPSPKFFFRYASEKLRISLTLYEIHIFLLPRKMRGSCRYPRLKPWHLQTLQASLARFADV